MYLSNYQVYVFNLGWKNWKKKSNFFGNVSWWQRFLRQPCRHFGPLPCPLHQRDPGKADPHPEARWGRLSGTSVARCQKLHPMLKKKTGVYCRHALRRTLMWSRPRPRTAASSAINADSSFVDLPRGSRAKPRGSHQLPSDHLVLQPKGKKSRYTYVLCK